MSRTALNFLLDTAMLVVFLGLLWIAAVVHLVFPSGSDSEGWSLWGWDRERWLGVHFQVLMVFTVMIVLHLMLHWTWICGVIANRLSHWWGRNFHLSEGTKTLYGVALLVVLLHILGIAYLTAMLTIVGPAEVGDSAIPTSR